MNGPGCQTPQPVVRLHEVSLRYGRTPALREITLDIPSGCMVGFIGPDGVGKSSLFSLVAGARAIQSGRIEVMGGDMADEGFRSSVLPRVAYMPQGLGKNLYATLSVFENVEFFGRLFGQGPQERNRRIGELLRATGLAPFSDRPAGKLSGGMRQKLGLCCALIHDPDLLILDEPTTGVDPLSRRQFWELVGGIRSNRPGMSLLIATAYMEEAARFDWLVAMNEGRVLATGTPHELLERTGSDTLERAFIGLLPSDRRAGHRPVEAGHRTLGDEAEVAIEARDLTRRFGDFTAVDHVSFSIRRGEIFGFLGSNGSGKTTTMKMLTGLLPASQGQAWLFGRPVDPHDLDTRHRVGYMTQTFSLYDELTVRQNLVLHARLYGIPENRVSGRVTEMAERFDLIHVIDTLPDALPLGELQKLSLAAAMIHGPETLILDEPTSGVDPVERDAFWRIMIGLARRDNVTIFISTHFMNEAERCDRISLMHAGRVLVSDTPAAIMKQRNVGSLEEAFISHLEEAVAQESPEAFPKTPQPPEARPPESEPSMAGRRAFLDLRRLLSYSWRESIELRRDPVRLTMAALGSIILMLVLGYGINMDVENIAFAWLDNDRTTLSRDYTHSLAGSHYFDERPPISDHAELNQRMRSGDISLAIEIPPGFARDAARGRPVEIGAWIDGSMPMRAETVRGYVQGIHQHWLSTRIQRESGAATGLFDIETRYRYNPELESLPAMVPAVIPMLLLLIPAILTALSVVREKELGSIVNLYVTPVTRLEFLLGKQIPYIVLALLSYLLLTALAVFLFRVRITGSFLALSLAATLYVIVATAMGMLVSTFMRSQTAALFTTAILTLVPTIQFSGLVDPVSSLGGVSRIIGEIFPATHFLIIARGTFSKGLGLNDLQGYFIPLLIAIPVLIGFGTVLLRKQER